MNRTLTFQISIVDSKFEEALLRLSGLFLAPDLVRDLRAALAEEGIELVISSDADVAINSLCAEVNTYSLFANPQMTSSNGFQFFRPGVQRTGKMDRERWERRGASVRWGAREEGEGG